MIVNEAHAVEKRIKKGKEIPGLISLNCYCLFFCRYLLPYRHMFHEHVYGENKLPTNDAWKQFQEMFTESGFKIYESRGLVKVNIP